MIAYGNRSNLANGVPCYGIASDDFGVEVQAGIARIAMKPATAQTLANANALYAQTQAKHRSERLGNGVQCRELEDRFRDSLRNQWRASRNDCVFALDGTPSHIDRVTRRLVNKLTQTVAGNRPAFVDSCPALGGRPAWDFGTAIGHSRLLSQATTDLITGPYWLMCIYAANVPLTKDCRIFGSDATANHYAELAFMGGNTLNFYNGGSATIASGYDGTSLLGHCAIINVQDIGYTDTSRSRAMILRSDGVIYRTDNINVATGNDSSTVAIGGFGRSTTQGFPGLIGDLARGSGLLSPVDFADIMLYTVEQNNFSLPSCEVLFDGNSLNVEATAWPYAIALASKPVRFCGAAGGRATPMVTGALRQTAQNQTAALPIPRIWCGGEISNDILKGASAADCIAHVRALIAEIRACGFAKIVMSTCGPRSDFTAGQVAIAAAVNADLVANWQAYGIDKLVNIHTAAAVDGQTCPALLLDPNSAAFDGGGVHHSVSGYVLYGEQFRFRLAQVGV